MSDGVGGDILRVDSAALVRAASALAELATGPDDDQVLADGAARLRSGATSANSTAPAVEVVDATQAQIRDVAAATTAFARRVGDAAQRYAEADVRAGGRMADAAADQPKERP